jgi:hypothetical protein
VVYPFRLTPILAGAMTPHSRHQTFSAAEEAVYQAINRGCERVHVYYNNHKIGSFGPSHAALIREPEAELNIARLMRQGILSAPPLESQPVRGKNKVKTLQLILDALVGIEAAISEKQDINYDQRAQALLDQLRPFLK